MKPTPFLLALTISYSSSSLFAQNSFPNDGKVSIGVPSSVLPDARLEVWSQGQEPSLDVVKSSGNPTDPILRVWRDNAKVPNNLALTVQGSGNIGIGVLAPSVRLQVAGDGDVGVGIYGGLHNVAVVERLGIGYKADGQRITGNCLHSADNLPLIFQTTQVPDAMVLHPNGHLVAGPLAIGSKTEGAALWLEKPQGDVSMTYRQAANGISYTMGLDATDPLKFKFNVGGSFLASRTIMTFDVANRVGIGTSSPRTTLDVVGEVTCNALNITGGSDLAWRFKLKETSNPGDGDIAKPLPGMLVSIDRSADGRLQVSRGAYDNAVAGVISGAGDIHVGMTMGQSGSMADGDTPVTSTGRVWVWADATHGPIGRGDRLTSSDTPGHAMKVSDREKADGAVIGKAMTELKSGKGLVLVWMSVN